jgi:hypothetical protein
MGVVRSAAVLVFARQIRTLLGWFVDRFAWSGFLSEVMGIERQRRKIGTQMGLSREESLFRTAHHLAKPTVAVVEKGQQALIPSSWNY